MYTFVASYFWSEYFFDCLGMKYAFTHLTWNFDSVLLGKGKQRVPIMMYFHGWYFFVTYHACSIVFMRMIRTGLPDSVPLLLRTIIATFVGAFFFAWAEIKFTTMEAIKDQFEYANMDWALTWGALLYSCYFLASFPLLQRLDEDKDDPPWTLTKTLENALAAGMIGFFWLDFALLFFIPSHWAEQVWFN